MRKLHFILALLIPVGGSQAQSPDACSGSTSLYEFKRNKKGVVDRLEVSVSRAERVLFNKTK